MLTKDVKAAYIGSVEKLSLRRKHYADEEGSDD